MLRVCPHCDSPLRVGEAYLGWCGACGENLFRKPSAGRIHGPLTEGRSSGDDPPPVPEEWRWVARGVLVKLLALIVGAVAFFAVALEARWDWRAALAAPLPWGAALLGAAALLDVVGRMLCLGTPQASIRWLIVLSVASQLGAVVAAVGYGLTPDGTEGRDGMLVSAVLGQVGAAAAFTLYLFAVGTYFRSPAVIGIASALKITGAAVYGAGAIFFGLLVFAILAFILGIALFFVCPCAGCVVMHRAGTFIESLGPAFFYTLAFLLLAVECAYAATLAALLRELWRRRLIGC